MTRLEPFRSTEIVPGVHMIDGAATERCFLVEGSRRWLLIDSLTGCGDLAAWIQTRWQPEDEPELVNTHGHMDHTGGNYSFRACAMHPADQPMFEQLLELDADAPDPRLGYLRSSEGRPEFRERVTAADLIPPRPMPVRPIADGEVFDLGSRQFEAILVPGHTRGSVTFYDRANRLLLTGDALNRNTLLIPPRSTSIARYRQSLLALRERVAPDTRLLSSHDPRLYGTELIDEGIELTELILAGRDDQVETTFMGMSFHYARAHRDLVRLDGGTVNIAYDPQYIHDRDDV
ncbi:MAG: MBL fold metallo-hydrolase [Bacillota bacterium]|nr:MBL fold metallo-hydrolase [Bacillota bacterium]